MINPVPNIEQQPRTASDTAIHYGYIAYKDIFVGDRWVQPRHEPNKSPYWQYMPARQLIPFTNVDEPEANTSSSNPGVNRVRPKNGSDPTVSFRHKPAKECAVEMESSYEGEGFVVLRALTGYSSEDAFKIFQTIQPFAYKLVDLEAGLEGAEDRITSDDVSVVEYAGETVIIDPLPNELRAAALQTLRVIKRSAELARTLAADIVESTRQKIEKYHATGEGKRTPDPHDKYIYSEMGEDIPQLVKTRRDVPVVQTVSGESPESLELKKREIELLEKQLELEERRLALQEKEANREKMVAVRAARKAEV